MTQFKKGDEVLVKAKFLCGREDWYYDNSKRKMYYDKAVLTFDYEIEGYFAPCVKDLIPASALDVNKELLAENEQLRNAIKVQANAVRVLHEAETSELNLLRKNAQEAYTAKATLDSEREANKILTDEIERLRKILEDVLETSGEQIPYGTVKAIRSALKEKE